MPLHRTQAALLRQLLHFIRPQHDGDLDRLLTMCNMLGDGCQSSAAATNFCALALSREGDDEAVVQARQSAWMYQVSKLTFKCVAVPNAAPPRTPLIAQPRPSHLYFLACAAVGRCCT